jgi:hypothetical protein
VEWIERGGDGAAEGKSREEKTRRSTGMGMGFIEHVKKLS